jgi:NAD(P) transhydrogenase subunit beta
VAGVAIGTAIGAVGARRVKMTAMPQMVALFNGVGGGAAALVAVAELLKLAGARSDFQTGVPSIFAIIVGGISFAGSAIAFAKLQEVMTGTPITYPGQQLVNGLLAVLILALAVLLLAVTGSPAVFVAMLVLALLLGVAFVLPIGGADMPVVISLLNAFTGLAVAASGFVLNNFALIVAGTLVGASGTLLTKLMSDAMGRSIGNVLFGAFGQVQAGAGGAAEAGDRSVRPGSADDIGTMLAYSRSGAGGGGERRCQPGRPQLSRQPHLRHADTERGRGAQRRLPQALDAPRLRRNRQRAPLRPQDDHALRRRQGIPDQTRRGGKGRIAADPSLPHVREGREGS